MELQPITEAEIQARAWVLSTFMPEALKLDERSRRDLFRLLDVVAFLELILEQQLQALPVLLDPELIPDRYVRALAAMVGLDGALVPVRTTTTADLRRLIPDAVATWKLAGTRPSLRNMVRAFTAARSVFVGWHDRAARLEDGLEGELVVLPKPGTTTAGPHSQPQHVLDAYVHDPEGGADLNLAAGWLSVVLEIRGTVNLIRCLLVEDLLVGTELWSGGPTLQDEDPALVVPAAGTVAADVAGLAVSWPAYTWRMRLELTGLDAYVIAFAAQARDLTGRRYTVNVDPAAGTWELNRRTGGGAVLLDSGLFPVAVGVPQDVRVVFVNDGAATHVSVHVDGDLVLEALDTHADRMLAGTVGWKAPTSALLVRGCTVTAPDADVVRVTALTG